MLPTPRAGHNAGAHNADVPVVRGPVAGVDGCRGGWIAAVVDIGPGTSVGPVHWWLFGAAQQLLALDAAVIGIDIPIGLPETGGRVCEALAKRRLGTAHSSIFLTPAREVLTAQDYPAANALSRRVSGKGLSKQSWHILDRIRDVDAALGEPPDPRFVEVHPELSFRALDPAVSLGKKETAGAGQRIRALNRWLDVGSALSAVPAGVGLDDALDALAAAWTAARWAAGAAEVLPDDPPVDRRGRPVRIVV